MEGKLVFGKPKAKEICLTIFQRGLNCLTELLSFPSNQIMTSDNFPFPLLVAYVVFFFLTFTLSVVGNTWVILNCWRALKRNKVSLTWCILNLAAADLLFTFLTIFNGIAFLWHWIGGDVLCKLQGFSVETTYTVSITNLVLISYQRLTAITDPLKTRARNILNKEYRKILLLWGTGVLACSPLLFLYQTRVIQEKEKTECDNLALGGIARKVFYSLHALFFFVFPLCYMFYSQSKIFRALRKQRIVPRTLQGAEISRRRHRKVAKTLLALTVVFVLCWSPFMTTRTLMYFDLAQPDMIWRASQLLLCLNTVLDPIMYGVYGRNLKNVWRVSRCCKSPRSRQPSFPSLLDRTNIAVLALNQTAEHLPRASCP